MKIPSFILVAIIACGLTACGNKGKLKSPTQIEEAEAKKRAHMEREDNGEDAEDFNLIQTDTKAAPNDAPSLLNGVPATAGESAK